MEHRLIRRAIYGLGPSAAATHRTATEPQANEDLLDHCRTVGWATEFEEQEPGSACIAAPIVGPGGSVVASVSIAGPAARFTTDAIERLGTLLLDRVREIAADRRLTSESKFKTAW